MEKIVLMKNALSLSANTESISMVSENMERKNPLFLFLSINIKCNAFQIGFDMMIWLLAIIFNGHAELAD